MASQELVKGSMELSPSELGFIEKAVEVQQAKLQQVLSRGKSYDFKMEYLPIWTTAWTKAVEREIDPRRVGTFLLNRYIQFLTGKSWNEEELFILVTRWGLLALEGVDSVIKHRPNQWFPYAWAVCQNQCEERRATG